MHVRWSLAVTAALIIGSGSVRADISEMERMTIPAADAGSLVMRDFAFADVVYTGIANATAFEIEFERIVTTDDREEYERLADDLNLDTGISGNRLTIRLNHPRQTGRGVFDRIFDRTEWRVRIAITGPAAVDLDMNTEFGESMITGTKGNLRVNANFTNITVVRHTGPLTGSLDFGRLDTESLDGSFDLESNFGGMELHLVRLRGNSRASTSFGAATIRLPDDTGADVYVDTSFAGIEFDTRVGVRHASDHHRIIGNGGDRIDLNANFGSITVSDYRTANDATTPVSTDAGTFPLAEGMEWEFRNGARSFTVRVESYSRMGGVPTAVLASDGRDAPFQRITLFQTDAGLFLTGIDGVFFGRDLSSVRFDPPKYWLPYDTSVTIGDVLLGTVDVDRDDGVFEYDITTPDGASHRIDVSPDGGFTRFDSFRVTGAPATKPEYEAPPPRPRFTNGEVRSLDIRLRGSKLLDEDDVIDRLNIRTGDVYSRDEIDDAVEALEDDRFIDSAYFRITVEGDLTVTVYERDILDLELDADFSFSRVGGTGIGPRATLTSLVGPFSELSASAEYHFGNKKWTYDVTGEKHFLDPAHQLTIGGGYREAYESAMDWAVARDEATANALLLGLENKHFFEVHGASAFVGFSMYDTFDIRTIYFDEEFSSLKKHTNWSLFNHRHTKEDNLPLSPAFETRYTGMRYQASILNYFGDIQNRITVEAEHGDPENTGVPESYTRWMGGAEMLWSRWNNLVRFRVTAGYSEDDLPPQRAFRLGGMNTLRGYDFESVPTLDPRAGNIGFLYGGNSMLLFNWDYVWIWDDDAGMAIFADAGNAWINDSDFDLSDLKRDVGVSFILGDMRSFPGLDFTDELGGLRVNWAVPVGNVPHTSHWTVNFTSMF